MKFAKDYANRHILLVNCIGFGKLSGTYCGYRKPLKPITL